MTRRRLTAAFVVGWAAAGSVIAVAGLTDVNSDARALVVAATLVGVAAALAAARCIAAGRERAGGMLLVVSVITPTFFAWPINVIALIVGALLVFDARLIVGASRDAI